MENKNFLNEYLIQTVMLLLGIYCSISKAETLDVSAGWIAIKDAADVPNKLMEKNIYFDGFLYQKYAFKTYEGIEKTHYRILSKPSLNIFGYCSYFMLMVESSHGKNFDIIRASEYDEVERYFTFSQKNSCPNVSDPQYVRLSLIPDGAAAKLVTMFNDFSTISVSKRKYFDERVLSNSSVAEINAIISFLNESNVRSISYEYISGQDFSFYNVIVANKAGVKKGFMVQLFGDNFKIFGFSSYSD